MLQNIPATLVPNRAAAAQSDESKPNNFRFALLFALLAVVVWVSWTSFWDAGLYGDNVEQFVWSHSMALGYYKHPPLPTWLLGLALSAVGPHWWLTNALATICVAATGMFTWLIARRLCGERTANIEIILWGLQQCFSVSAEIYNHNTVLVLCLSALTYAVLRALSSTHDMRWWVASGVLAACAMLSKYQAALPLLGLVIAIFLTGKSRRVYLLGRVTIVLAVFVMFFGPHLYWGIANHFPSLRYASDVIESGNLVRRAAWVATFAINQVRMVLPLLITLLFVALVARFWRRDKASPASPAAPLLGATRIWSDRDVSIWIACLVWGPVLALVLVSVLSGSALRNHWGVQLFQFFALWVAWRWRASQVWNFRSLVAVALIVHIAGLTYYAVKQSDPLAVLAERRADSSYPGQRMSDAAVAHWKRFTPCPLRIVAGDFEAGLVSAYAKEYPAVFTSTVATPWVKQLDLEQFGALYVAADTAALPTGLVQKVHWSIGSATQPGKDVQFAIRPPAVACPAGR